MEIKKIDINKAMELAKPYLLEETNESVFVAADHAVYVNSELEPVQAHCDINSLQLHVIKIDGEMKVEQSNEDLEAIEAAKEAKKAEKEAAKEAKKKK